MAARAGNDFDVMAILRAYCPLLSKARLPDQNTAELLGRLRKDVAQLEAMMQLSAKFTIRDVLAFVRDHELFSLDERFETHFASAQAADDGAEAQSVAAFLACSVAELWGYRDYVEDQSPFSTQQGVKGAEFNRVLVILDDEEGAYNLFSYGKYFGITPLSETDEKNLAEGSDSVLGRTRRLFYVCCSRAVQDLAVVFFVPDVTAARGAIEVKGLFPPADIHGWEMLENIQPLVFAADQ